MALTDTHTHLYYEDDNAKLNELVKRSVSNGVSRLFLPNVDSSTICKVFNLTDLYPKNCFPMLGLHPCEVKQDLPNKADDYINQLDLIYTALKTHNVVAIGEIGIDLYWDKTTLGIQKDAFRTQVNWALEYDLPIVIHNRDAFDEVYETLMSLKHPQLRGIFHCFTGDAEQAKKIIGLGFLIGIGGVVTYKNSGLDEVVRGLNLRNIVLETDSPYLAPVPYRGKQNESSYLVYIAQKVADIHQVTLEEVERITTENSRTLFGV